MTFPVSHKRKATTETDSATGSGAKTHAPGGKEHERRKQVFAARLSEHMVVSMGIPRERCSGWLQRRIRVRWQTAQYWLLGKRLPAPEAMELLCEALGVTSEYLDPPMAEGVGWAKFLLSPDGKGMDSDERFALATFYWPPGSDPSEDVYRLLLVARRMARKIA